MTVLDVQALTDAASAGCCGPQTPGWGRHFCPYHEGFQDGAVCAVLALRALGVEIN